MTFGRAILEECTIDRERATLRECTITSGRAIMRVCTIDRRASHLGGEYQVDRANQSKEVYQSNGVNQR